MSARRRTLIVLYLAAAAVVLVGIASGALRLSGDTAEPVSGIPSPALTSTPAPASTTAPAATPSPNRSASPPATPSPTIFAIPSPTASATPTATPSPSPTPVVHIVKPGESLTSIAARYGVTPQAIRRANHLKSANLLRIGQKLVIPPVG